MGFGDGSANSQEGTPNADGPPGPDMVLEVRSRPASPDFNVLREVRVFEPSLEKLVSDLSAVFLLASAVGVARKLWSLAWWLERPR